MKRSLLAVLFLVSAAWSQTESAPAQTPAPAQETEAAKPEATVTPTPDEPAPPPSNEPQAKSQEELDAYVAAVTKPDLAAAEEALKTFVMQYPDSDLRAQGYSQLMQKAQQTGNLDKTLELGRKSLTYDPKFVTSLVTIANVLADSSEKSPDKTARYAEAVKDADDAVAAIKGGANVPANTPEAAVLMRNGLLVLAYNAKGTVKFNQKDWAGTEEALKPAADIKAQAIPELFMRLAIAQDNLKKYKDALASVNAAISAAESQKRNDLLPDLRRHRERLASLAGGSPAKKTTKK